MCSGSRENAHSGQLSKNRSAIDQAPNPKVAMMMRQAAGLNGDDKASVVVGLKRVGRERRGDL